MHLEAETLNIFREEIDFLFFVVRILIYSFPNFVDFERFLHSVNG